MNTVLLQYNLVQSSGRSREDPDGIEHLVLGFFAIAASSTFAAYPFIGYVCLREDMHMYNHVLYFLQGILSEPTALIIGLAGTGFILTLLIGLSFIFTLLIVLPMTMYVVSLTSWMIMLRKLW